MILIFVPILYLMYGIFWALVLGTMLVVYLACVVIIFLLTALAMLVGSAWRPSRPSKPRRPTPQARWSNRR